MVVTDFLASFKSVISTQHSYVAQSQTSELLMFSEALAVHFGTSCLKNCYKLEERPRPRSGTPSGTNIQSSSRR